MKKKILSVILASVMCLTSLFTVEAATGSPVISVTAEAATYKTGTYKVSHKNGVNVRKKASTSSTVVGASAKGTTFTVKEIKRANGLDWGRTDSIKCTNGKKSGWVALKYCTYQGKPEPAKPAEITFKGVSFPSSITKGKGQHLAGTISSTQNITKIKAVVDNYTTDKTVMEYTVKPNSKSYALYDSSLDWSLSFGKLSEGDYRLTYHVWSGSTTHSMNMLFTVKGKTPATTTDNTNTITTVTTTPTNAMSAIMERALKDVGVKMSSKWDEAWCAHYVSYVLNNYGNYNIGDQASCGVLSTTIAKKGKGTVYAFNDTYYNYVKNETTKNLERADRNNFTPPPGDIVVFKFDSKDRASHVGFVYSYNSSTEEMTTIEGNTSCSDGEHYDY